MIGYEDVSFFGIKYLAVSYFDPNAKEEEEHRRPGAGDEPVGQSRRSFLAGQ